MIIKHYADGIAFIDNGEEVAFYSIITDNITFKFAFKNKFNGLRMSFSDYEFIYKTIQDYKRMKGAFNE